MAELVSILIPTYNREHCIAETLSSALAQTYSNIEIVLVDNASTDATWDIVSEFAGRDARVRAFRNESNIGPVRNWLRCVEYAAGDYIKILWSDDLIHSSFLAKTMPALQDERVGFVYSSVRVFAGDSPENGDFYYTVLGTGRHPTSIYLEGGLLGYDFPVSPGCALFRAHDVRECLLEQVPNRVGSDFSMHAIGNDLLLFLLIAARYPYFSVIADPLSYFRSHAGSITVSSTPGRIPLHYDLAKAYFLSQVSLDDRLCRRFNATLLLHRLRYNAAAARYNIHRLADFYPHGVEPTVDYVYLLRMLVKGLLRLLRKSRS